MRGTMVAAQQAATDGGGARGKGGAGMSRLEELDGLLHYYGSDELPADIRLLVEWAVRVIDAAVAMRESAVAALPQDDDTVVAFDAVLERQS